MAGYTPVILVCSYMDVRLWRGGWIQITCCSASLKHYLYSRRESQAARGLFPTRSAVSCFTASHCLNSESARLQLASYLLQPCHSMTSCHFSTLPWCSFPKQVFVNISSCSLLSKFYFLQSSQTLTSLRKDFWLHFASNIYQIKNFSNIQKTTSW